MSFELDPNNPDIETSNENVKGVGTYVFETNFPDGATWTSGLTVDIDMQSAYPGDEDQWENLHQFTEKGTKRIDLIEGRKYRVVASEKGPWVRKDFIGRSS